MLNDTRTVRDGRTFEKICECPFFVLYTGTLADHLKSTKLWNFYVLNQLPGN